MIHPLGLFNLKRPKQWIDDAEVLLGVSQSEAVISPCVSETWQHIGVDPGVGVILRSDLPKHRSAEIKELMARIEDVLRKSL